MSRKFSAALLALCFVASSGHAKTIHIEDNGDVIEDTPGCARREFTAISPASRTRVRRFWFDYVQPHWAENSQLAAQMLQELAKHASISYTGSELDAQRFSEAERQKRDQIRADYQRRDQQRDSEYRAQYQSFIASLPEQDQQPARMAMAIVTCPQPTRR